jgi:hypothetical protein
MWSIPYAMFDPWLELEGLREANHIQHRLGWWGWKEIGNTIGIRG